MTDHLQLIKALQPHTEKQNQWRKNAACLNSNPELFFPSRGTRHTKIEEARQICHNCSSKQECYEYAIKYPDRLLDGIWAGLTASERRNERKRLGLTSSDGTAQ